MSTTIPTNATRRVMLPIDVLELITRLVSITANHALVSYGNMEQRTVHAGVYEFLTNYHFDRCIATISFKAADAYVLDLAIEGHNDNDQQRLKSITIELTATKDQRDLVYRCNEQHQRTLIIQMISGFYQYSIPVPDSFETEVHCIFSAQERQHLATVFYGKLQELKERQLGMVIFEFTREDILLREPINFGLQYARAANDN